MLHCVRSSTCLRFAFARSMPKVSLGVQQRFSFQIASTCSAF
jgi:hypothetical protein